LERSTHEEFVSLEILALIRNYELKFTPGRPGLLPLEHTDNKTNAG